MVNCSRRWGKGGRSGSDDFGNCCCCVVDWELGWFLSGMWVIGRWFSNVECILLSMGRDWMMLIDLNIKGYVFVLFYMLLCFIKICFFDKEGINLFFGIIN